MKIKFQVVFIYYIHIWDSLIDEFAKKNFSFEFSIYPHLTSELVAFKITRKGKITAIVKEIHPSHLTFVRWLFNY